MEKCNILLNILSILFIWLVILYKKKRDISIQLNSVIKESNKNWTNYNVAIKLLYEIQNGTEIAKRVEANGFSNIAVYGMGPIGRFLIEELLKNGIQVSYAIDQNSELIYADITVYNLEDVLPQADIVIITVIHSYEEIKKILKDKIKCPVVSMEAFLT